MKTLSRIRHHRWTVVFVTLGLLFGGIFAPVAWGQRGNPPRDDRRGKRPPRRGEQDRERNRYSISQAISDQAQLHTIAFSGLAFLTGDMGSYTLIPPGKVSDFFGFQCMRDIDTAGKGHNPMFLDRVAANVTYILSEKQRNDFARAAREQAPLMREIAVKRFPLIKAFYRQLTGDIPAGSSGLNKSAVIHYASDIYELDARLAYKRAQAFGKIATSLTNKQKKYLGKMQFGNFNTWPNASTRNLKMRGVPKLVNVGYMTLASEFFSWYAGSVEADTYFCPERHGTYFGAFYMKGMPAMGKRDYDISTALTGDSGKTFLEILTRAQRAHVTGIIEKQRGALTRIVKARRSIATRLRGFLKGNTPNEKGLLALGRQYGQLDGEVSWHYATVFAKVRKTLSAAQRRKMLTLRKVSTGSGSAFMYSEPINMPTIPNTDFLFGVKGKSRK